MVHLRDRSAGVNLGVVANVALPARSGQSLGPCLPTGDAVLATLIGART